MYIWRWQDSVRVSFTSFSFPFCFVLAIVRAWVCFQSIFIHFFYSCRSTRYFYRCQLIFRCSCRLYLVFFISTRGVWKSSDLFCFHVASFFLHFIFFSGIWEWEALIHFFLLLLIRVIIFLFYFQPKSKDERSHSTKIWYHYFESTTWQRRWISHRKHGTNNRAASRIDCTSHFLNAKHAIQLRQLARCVRCFSWYIRFMLYLIVFLSTLFSSYHFIFHI